MFVVSAGLDKFTLYENDFKNLKTHWPSKFELDNSTWLAYSPLERICSQMAGSS